MSVEAVSDALAITPRITRENGAARLNILIPGGLISSPQPPIPDPQFPISDPHAISNSQFPNPPPPYRGEKGPEGPPIVIFKRAPVEKVWRVVHGAEYQTLDVGNTRTRASLTPALESVQ